MARRLVVAALVIGFPALLMGGLLAWLWLSQVERPGFADREVDVSIEVTARRFEYDPAVVTVREGQVVEFVLRSEDAAHGFAIAAFGVNAVIQPGKETSVRFRADRAGAFRIGCSVYCGPGHPTHTGELVVLPADGDEGGDPV